MNTVVQANSTLETGQHSGKARLTLSEKVKREILEWLFPGSFSDRHEAIQARCVEDSRLWFWESAEVQSWVKGTSSKLLVCHGMRKPSLSHD